MTKNGKPKTVAELREALERLNEERAGYLTAIAEAEEKIKQCARQIFDGDGEAAERRKGYKMRRATLRDGVEQIDMILPDLQRELAEAIAAEAQVARETDADAAQAFAQTLPNLFRECDRHLANFRRSYTDCINAVREARAKRWSVPSEELMTSKLIRAIKTAFSVGELRSLDMSPISPTERTSFGGIGESYAAAIIGAARQSLISKPVVTSPQAISSTAAKSDDGRLPPRGDVGRRFADDPKEFEIRIPTAR